MAACEGGTGPAAGHAVRDSAGIRIVENTSADAGEWLLADAPILQIGVLDGAPEYQLHEVSAAARLSDGRIVIADEGSAELRFYSGDGSFLQTAGVAGQGPGEFRSLEMLVLLPGDSLLVYDRDLNRLSYFDATGRFLRSLSLPPPPGGNTVPRFGGRFNDGSFLITTERGLSNQTVEADGVVRHPVAFLRFDAEGVFVDSLTSLPGTEYVVRQGEVFMTSNLPLGRTSLHVLADDRLFVGDNDAYEVRVLGSDAAVLAIVRRDHEPLPVPTDRLWRYLDSILVADVEDETFRHALEEMFRSVPMPETMPAYAALAVDDVGNLWVRDSALPDAEYHHWTVFGVDGVLLARIATPGRFRPYHIGSDFLLGTWTDEFDVEYVRLYGLTKP